MSLIYPSRYTTPVLSTNGRFFQLPKKTPDKESQTLHNYLSGLITAQTAAADYTSTLSNAPADKREYYRIWQPIVEVAQLYPETQEGLVQLLGEIQQLPSTRSIHEVDNPKSTGSEELPWADLPEFGWVMRDCWNYFDTPSSDPNQRTLRLYWLNINAFAARLTNANLQDYTTFGLWSLREALEEETGPQLPLHPHPTDHDDPNKSTVNALDGLLPAAAQWIFHAGKPLFECEVEIEPSHLQGDPLRGGALWKGKHGFCQERWRFWKERFLHLAGVAELESETREVAKKAAEKMDAVERE